MLASRRSKSTSIFVVPQKYHPSPLKVKLFSIVMNTHTYIHTYIHKTKPVSETLNKDTGNAYTALYFPNILPVPHSNPPGQVPSLSATQLYSLLVTHEAGQGELSKLDSKYVCHL